MFHGAKDRFVPVAEARELFNTLQAQGVNVRYTEYSELGHRCWKRTYAEPELWPWLLAQHLEPEQAKPRHGP
jgi:predicted esterase